LIVGYGVETDIIGQNMPYWTIKNSWSADWGDSGYIYVRKNFFVCFIYAFGYSFMFRLNVVTTNVELLIILVLQLPKKVTFFG
jgi:hypothetical protein